MLQSKSNSFSSSQKQRAFFMNKKDVNFAVNVFFPVFLASYEAQIQNAQSSILETTKGKLINFANMKNFSDTQKQDFVFEFLLIHGNINSPLLSGFSTRLFTQKKCIHRKITLQFADEKETARYMTFYKALIGLGETTSEVA